VTSLFLRFRESLVFVEQSNAFTEISSDISASYYKEAYSQHNDTDLESIRCIHDIKYCPSGLYI